jgi:hypothetical protein
MSGARIRSNRAVASSRGCIGAAATLATAAGWLTSGMAFACLTMPRDLARPHAGVIADAKQIFWAEVVGTQAIWKVGKARKPVRYKLRVLRVFKGRTGSTFNLEGENESSGWDTTFHEHADDEFWKRASGRMGIMGDCSMEPPHFVVGKRYLVILGLSADTKQFERVDSEGDRWLKYVEKTAAGAK